MQKFTTVQVGWVCLKPAGGGGVNALHHTLQYESYSGHTALPSPIASVLRRHLLPALHIVRNTSSDHPNTRPRLRRARSARPLCGTADYPLNLRLISTSSASHRLRAKTTLIFPSSAPLPTSCGSTPRPPPRLYVPSKCRVSSFRAPRRSRHLVVVPQHHRLNAPALAPPRSPCPTTTARHHWPHNCVRAPRRWRCRAVIY